MSLTCISVNFPCSAKLNDSNKTSIHEQVKEKYTPHTSTPTHTHPHTHPHTHCFKFSNIEELLGLTNS